MAPQPSQAQRAASLKTPLGEDELVLSRFDGTEGVNELFEWRIEASSIVPDINFDQLIGKNATVSAFSITDKVRIFDGIVTEVQWLGQREDLFSYRLILRPWLYLLSHRKDCFIFHDMTVVDIVAQVFGRHSFANFEDRTNKSYPVIEYCVQYRETDMAFVLRLMEQFGINWFFIYEDGSHKLIMVDASAQYEQAAGGARPYIALEGKDRRDRECFHHFIPERRFTSGKATFRDYNFKTPSAKMDAEYSGSASYENAGLEVYDWPGGYITPSDGKPIATVNLQAAEGQDRRCMAAGNCVTLISGSIVKLEKHPFDYNAEYLVLRIQHSLSVQSYRSGSNAGAEEYEGHFELLNSEIQFQPSCVTPRPHTGGPQTAVVVGEDNEEIDCDEYGRILVRFHWDREKDCSMRCRVAQNWASGQWGGMVIPRIGMEVVVEYLEGDPDRPLVTGCVYNAKNMPPYSLPRFKTRSTWRSNSHKASGFNEIRFEDEGGQEEIYVHAQRYMNVTVGVHQTWSVGVNQHSAIGKNLSETVGENKSVSIGMVSVETIGGAQNLTVGADRIVTVGGEQHTTIGADGVTAIAGDGCYSTGGGLRVASGKGQNVVAGTTYYLEAGTSVVVSAGASISLNAGGSLVNIDASGVQIMGKLVLINSGGMPGIGISLLKKVIKAAKKYAEDAAKKYARSSEK